MSIKTCMCIPLFQHLTQKQVTAVESLRAQLAEANEKINNLSAEVHDRKGGLRHNQLEELRNLQVYMRALITDNTLVLALLYVAIH